MISSNNSNSPSAKPVPVVVPWILWFAILMGYMMLTFLMGGGIPWGGNPAGGSVSPIVYLCVLMVFIACGVRWFLIPRLVGKAELIPALIVGLAISEASGLLGIVMVPKEEIGTRMVIWFPAFFSILQFIPIFARRSRRDAAL